ncbi:hypothetical protein V1525DRAFT_396862 [Lipomyces kononenkoae]|uniref:Uncharacterized protein n=1 Tax=Lipomyces kononenkoae TaxID=34357 RepID=A0ACC3T795_LIPKO
MTMNSILAILFRQRNDAVGHIQQHIDEKKFATLGDNLTGSDITNHETQKKMEHSNRTSTAHRPRPSTNRRVSTIPKGGLIIESRKTEAAKQRTSSVVLEVHGAVAAAASFTRLLQHKERAHVSQPGEHRIRKKISMRIYRVTDEYIPQCQNLVDHVFTNDPLCQYLRGLTITDRESYATTKRYYKVSRHIAMCRAAVKGDISLRAAVVSSETVTGTIAPSAPLEVVKEAKACAGFALWCLSPEAPYSWQLLLFDLKTAPRRFIAMLDALYFAFKTGNFYYSDRVPGGVVDENRYSSYMRSRQKILRALLKGRRYLTIKNLGVLEEFRNAGIGSELLQYGLDMADTQNLPIYIETSSPKFVKFCEKFQFKLLHELRLFDGPRSTFSIRSQEMRTKSGTEGARECADVSTSTLDSGPSSNESEDKSCQAHLPIRRTCSVYCMIREPAVKKLTPLPVLQPNLGHEDAKSQKIYD